VTKPKQHQHIPSNWEQREILREKGQFWTPDWLAKAMVAYVAKADDLIFDPAAGNGAFFDALLKLGKPQKQFHGMDIDAAALSSPVYKQNNCTVEKRDFIKEPPNKKFSAIVANPPYIRHQRIDASTKEHLRKLATRITGGIIDGRAGFHIYFFIQALDMLAPNGRLAFVMPADTCEGKFSKTLWNWISKTFQIEAVVTFTEGATPFPNVDTNALVFFIKNAPPTAALQWVRARRAYSDDLLNFVESDFGQHDFPSLEIHNRELGEAVKTGLSRPPQNGAAAKFRLRDFASVMRGIVTGANEFFLLTDEQAKDLNIPPDFLKRVVGRTRDVPWDELTEEKMREIENKRRPTNLFYTNGHAEFPPAVSDYLKVGERMGVPLRQLIKLRRPWYKMETRKVPPLLFAYLGRRNSRFIRNTAGVLPLTGFLCVYPHDGNPETADKLWRILNHPDTLQNLALVGKTYGSGAIKVEPQCLVELPISEEHIRKNNLDAVPVKFTGKQPELF
jgi:hypothetical protein